MNAAILRQAHEYWFGLLARPEDSRPTAVLCACDVIALGVLHALRSAQLSVPGDVSVVGFDDIELAQFVSPPLTTVHQSKLRLGQGAMEMLLALMKDCPVDDRIMPTDLILRESTSALERGI